MDWGCGEMRKWYLLIFYLIILFCFSYISFYFILFFKTISVQEKYNVSHMSHIYDFKFIIVTLKKAVKIYLNNIF